MKKKLFSCVMASAMLVGAIGTGCSPSTTGIDKTKTQLYIANYDGGIGHMWLDDAIERFEDYYQDTEFESGKKGVEVHPYNTKSLSLSTMKTSNYYLYFAGVDSIATHISQGDFLNITDIVKEEKLPNEEETIEDKLSEATMDGLTAIDGNYYCLPMQQTFGGVTYNSHLFKKEGLFFADNASESPVQNVNDPRYGFVLKTSVKKSTGPDGLYGTGDDGLPSSIEEYKKLCDCMIALNITPFICYASSFHYTQHLLTALWSNLGGANDVQLSLNFNGTTNIVKVDSGNKVVVSEGKPVIERDVAIDETKGHLITRQESRYYALDFLQYIFNPKNINTYMDPASVTSALSHTDAQLDFLIGEANGKPIGMLIEGSYWENESRDASNLQYVKDTYPMYYDELEYKFMPMPIQYEGRVEARGTVGENGVAVKDGYKQTFVTTDTYGFINKHAVKNNEVAQRVAKLFLQFCCTDESLQQSNIITGMTSCYNYDLTDNQYSNLNSFAKSIYDLKNESVVIANSSNSPIFVKNSSIFSLGTLVSSVWTTNKYTYPLNAFRAGESLNDYFELLCDYHDQAWWNKVNS